MHYMLLIYTNTDRYDGLPPEARSEITERYRQLYRDLEADGRLISSAPLARSSTATTVAVRGGKTVATDGPFIETKEQLAGYFMIDAADLDEACAVAARIPDSEVGTIEVRPLFSHG